MEWSETADQQSSTTIVACLIRVIIGHAIFQVTKLIMMVTNRSSGFSLHASSCLLW